MDAKDLYELVGRYGDLLTSNDWFNNLTRCPWRSATAVAVVQCSRCGAARQPGGGDWLETVDEPRCYLCGRCVDYVARYRHRDDDEFSFGGTGVVTPDGIQWLETRGGNTEGGVGAQAGPPAR